MFHAAHAKKGSQPPKPVEVRRPTAPADETKPTKRQATSEELKAWFTATGGSVRYTGPRAAPPAA